MTLVGFGTHLSFMAEPALSFLQLSLFQLCKTVLKPLIFSFKKRATISLHVVQISQHSSEVSDLGPRRGHNLCWEKAPAAEPQGERTVTAGELSSFKGQDHIWLATQCLSEAATAARP